MDDTLQLEPEVLHTLQCVKGVKYNLVELQAQPCVNTKGKIGRKQLYSYVRPKIYKTEDREANERASNILSDRERPFHSLRCLVVS